MEPRLSSKPAPHALDPGTAMGTVRLTIADLDRAQDFYARAIGLREVERSRDVARLGAEPGAPLLELVGRPDTTPRPRRATGLFHLAILVPSRAELARALKRVIDAGGSFTGASDHLVSEALYLDDPEGNGIELYRDRPREDWPRADGMLRMATDPLDVDSLMADLPGGPDEGMPQGTRMGHVHLQVADLAPAEAFYNGVLGFDVTVRGYPGALFLSAGGYHHHIGVNTWNSAGAPHPGPNARGLSHFDVVVPDGDELERVAGRIDAAGLASERSDGALLVADPSGNRVRLRAA
ncbi:MAG TPA: VOC family protein [Thermoleophilaceae bacterium]|jgi:catechol 2,3-dioxygenase